MSPLPPKDEEDGEGGCVLCGRWGGGENGWVGAIAKEKRSIYFSGRMGRAARACQWAPSRAGESGEGEKKCIQNNFKKLTFCEWTLSLSRIDDDQNFTIKPKITKRTF